MASSRLPHLPARPFTALILTLALLWAQLALLPAGALSAEEAASTVRLLLPDSVQPSERSRSPESSDDGRYVVFESDSVYSADAPFTSDPEGNVYLHDRSTGSTTFLAQGSYPSISGDGNVVGFLSTSNTLVDGDTNGGTDVFVWVRDPAAPTGTFQRMSTDWEGAQAPGAPHSRRQPALSHDGTYVAFETTADLTGSGTGSTSRIYRKNRLTQAVDHVSVGAMGAAPDSFSDDPDISADGSAVVFTSNASNLVSNDDNGATSDVFRRHLPDCPPGGECALPFTVRISQNGEGGSNGGSFHPSISGDGKRVVFKSSASNLVTTDTNGTEQDVFLHDGTVSDPSARMSIVSLNAAGAQPTNGATAPVISTDGGSVTFSTNDPLVAGDENGFEQDVYQRDLEAGTTRLVSVDAEGGPADGPSGVIVPNDGTPAVSTSADGAIVAFESSATDLVAGDSNGQPDVFVRAAFGLQATLTVQSPATLEGPPSVPAGARDVDVAHLPVERLIDHLASGAPEASPLAKMPLAKMPLAKMPLAKMPLAKMPLAKMPLAKMPLAKMPVQDGWEQYLVGTALEGVPLVTLTLQDIYDLDGGTTLGKLTLEQADLAAAFPQVGLTSLALGSTPLAKMPAGDVVTGGWCAYLTSVGYPCPADAVGYLDSTSLIELDIDGVPLAKMPLAKMPLAKMDIVGSPLADVPLAKMAVGSTPLAKMPLAKMPLAGSPFGAVTLHTISTDQAELDRIFDCSLLGGCGSDQTTVADAETAGAIRATAVLADLAPAFGTLTLGDVLAHFDVDVPFGVVILSLLDLADYPWEALDLEALGVQDFAPSGSSVTYRLTVQVTGSGTAPSGTATVTMPEGFRYVDGSGYLETTSVLRTIGSATRDPIEPASSDGSTVSFDLGAVSSGVTYGVEFAARPGLTLGTFPSEATVVAGAAVATAGPSAHVTVTENWEDSATGGPNDAAAGAPIAEAGHVYIGHIAEAGDVDHYRVPAPPVGTRISVRLSNLASDNDLVMYRPVAEAAPSDVPRRAAPLASTPLADEGAGTHQAAETLDDVPLADVGAGPADISASRTGEEEVDSLALTDASGQHYTIQVSGFNDAVADDHYQMLVKYVPVLAAPSCARSLPYAQGDAPTEPVRYWDGTAFVESSTLPAGTDAVLLVNQQRLRGTYDVTGHATVMQALDAFLKDSAGLAGNPIDAAVVSVDASGPVRDAATAWDASACVPEEANRYAAVVNSLVRSLRTPSAAFDHLVMVGGDDIIPMARLMDDTTEANEDTYADVFSAAGPLQAALLTRHFLSDDPYGDLDPIAWLDRSLYVPDVALGRLVESPDDIAGQLQLFLASSGVADPSTAVTTGYDFLADGATLVDSNLGARIPASGRSTLINETWTRGQVVDALLPGSGTSPDIASVNAHYDHYRALPAIGNATHDESDLFTVADIPTSSQPLSGGILFSMGCHSGLSVPDAYVASDSGLAEDWAQTYGRQRAIWIGNTGYGYGDTEALALSEQLMADLAENLDGTMSVGEALIYAKHEYFGLLGVYGAYDEKVLQQPVFYGLPMYRIGDAPAPAATAATSTVVPSPTSLTGVASAEVSFDLSTTLHPTVTERGTFYTVDGQTPQVTHFRPIQPRTGTDVTVAGSRARGAIITSLTSTDVGVNPVLHTPTVDLASTSPETLSDVDVFPANLLNVSSYETPAGPAQRLVLIPGQYFADQDGTSDTGVQRLYEDVGTVVYYNDSAAAEHVRPGFLTADASIASTATGNEVTFEIRVVDRADVAEAIPTGTVHRVLVMFKDDAGWHPLDLEQDATDPLRWTKTTTVSGTRTEFLAQAVDSNGNVGVTTNKGRLFDTYLLPAGQVGPPPVPEVTFSGTQAAGGWYRGDVTVQVTGTEGVTYTTTVDGSTRNTVVGDGVHLVEVRGSDASHRALSVGIDSSPPTVAIDTPDVVQVGEVLRAQYRCDDPHSGITGCEGPQLLDTSQPGTHEYEVAARNRAGLTTVVGGSYTVVEEQADTVAPTVSDVQLSSNPIPMSTGSTEVSALAADDGSGISTVELLVEGRAAPVEMTAADGRYRATVDGFAAGIYAVSVRVRDVAGNEVTSDVQLLAVYDPNGGFVTGGGWIDSPPGAYRADVSLTGRANFGFVSKYQKGATAPSGRTEFHFKAGGFTFFSESYQWLVVSGHKAQYKGTGSVNGTPGYGFLLTAHDGQATGGDGFDRFRLKVWRLVTDEVVYDNVFADSDDIDETKPQLLGGGSVVIHKKK